MAYLTWISDQDLQTSVQQLLTVAQITQDKARTSFNKNVIDPFSAIFQIAGFNTDYDKWVLGEYARQSQKTLQNHIGEFHQTILGYVVGWENLKTGNVMDLLSDDRKILAEIKNKHNTVKGSNLSDLYKSMESQVMPKASRYRDYTAYYVTIIPKKPERFNKPFTPSDGKTGAKLPENEKIRIIDGASFYSMVTGENNALEQLFNVLPDVIRVCSGLELSGRDIYKLKVFFSSAYGAS
ncbi:Eco47II family restriction endonuclease [Tunicatimonas pelagia]|uniref:Eco47II family restriction endonuclease n=1 Tax=Tunicatimonas pelagia TaxID=931531 RepID=UPI00266618FA|nr:Eco47II family restriction endonuclease [Tunicatimonas pelagia]WKN45138.1 Eco47II family restriction endonuclease [Tunicatimonas pelagia]